MTNLSIPSEVGRGWGGRGGGGRGWGGRGWGGRGGGRHRAFGGYGSYGGYGGNSYYGYPWFPIATEEIVELSPGVPVQITTNPRAVTLLSGLGSGRSDRELADLGALIAPGSSGLTVQLSLGADRRLHASICIDGECYQGSVDLSAVLDRIASGIASYHSSLHLPPGNVAENPGAVESTANATNAAVEAAGDLLVGALIDQHCATLSAGWWHSLTHAVYGVHRAVAKTIKTFKEPITVAAAAVATAYGGPAAGATAAKLTGPIIDVVATDFKSSKDAKAVVDAAHAAAQSDPRTAKALAEAHKAVADTAAAYHITATAADAAGGNPAAARKLADLDRAAASGDTAAQRAMSVIAQAFSAAGNNANQGGPTTTGGALVPFALGAAAGAAVYGGYRWWRHHHARKAERAAAAIEHPATAPPPDPAAAAAPSSSPAAASGELIGAAITTLRREAQQAVVAAHARDGATALGYVKDGHIGSVLPFPSLDDADDWFGALDRRRYLYAAYFDATDPTWPSPINEQLGGPAARSARARIGEALL